MATNDWAAAAFDADNIVRCWVGRERDIGVEIDETRIEQSENERDGDYIYINGFEIAYKRHIPFLSANRVEIFIDTNGK